MKPIVVFDLETTGLSKDKDQIIQFAGIKIDMETHKVINELNLYIQPVGNYTISIAAFYAHHLTSEFLSDKPHMSDVADQIVEFFGDSDVLTYNGTSFDIPFLISELNKCGRNIDFLSRHCYDAFMEEKRRHPNTLRGVYQRYKGKTMDDSGLTAHDALSDVKATYAVFYAQQKEQPYNPEQMFGEDNFIQMMEFDGTYQPCFGNGKYRNVAVDLVAKIDQSYLKWVVSDKSSFTQSTKNYINKFIND